MFKPKNGEIDLPDGLEKIAGGRANLSRVYDEVEWEKIRQEAFAQLKILCPNEALFSTLSAKITPLSSPNLERISRLAANSKNALTFFSNEKLKPGLIAHLLEEFSDDKLAMIFSLSPELTSNFMDLSYEARIEALRSSKSLADFQQSILDNGPTVQRPEEEPYELFDSGLDDED